MPPNPAVLREPALTADQTIALADGRTLGWREFGDPAGVPVIALHGTPGSRLKFSNSDDAARRLGLRLISVDRWGYGLTSPRPGGSLTDFGQDTVALADRLGLQHCLVIGVSGGGPWAVASAFALQSRAIALALVAPVGLIDRNTRLSPFHGLCFRVVPHIPGFIRVAFLLFRTTLWLAPDLTMRLALSLAPAIDRAAIADSSIRRRLSATFVSGLAPGVSGPVIDVALFAKPWGIDPAEITAPVRVWIGTADRNVPRDGVKRLAAAMPSATLIELPGEGHLWIAQHDDIVVSWLAAMARDIGPVSDQVGTTRARRP